jgi:hypothetical protein
MDKDNDTVLHLCDKFGQALAVNEGNVHDESLDPPFGGSEHTAEQSTLHSAQAADMLAIK